MKIRYCFPVLEIVEVEMSSLCDVSFGMQDEEGQGGGFTPGQGSGEGSGFGDL